MRKMSKQCCHSKYVSVVSLLCICVLLYNLIDGMPNYYKDTIDDTYINYLGNQLKNKLEFNIPQDPTGPYISHTCIDKEVLEKHCLKNGCLQTQLPRDPRSRIEQLVRPAHMRLEYKYRKASEDMRESVKGYYDIIFATAASSNHYLESKALLANLQKNVFPYLKNFTLIYYDLGLNETERADISTFCKCQIRNFPFSRFPEFFKTLKCFAWKPIIVHAHAPRSRVIHWLDSSIRFYDSGTQLNNLYRQATERGFITLVGLRSSPMATLVSTFHFFGDEPCAYDPYFTCMAGLAVFHNEPLILDAVITPWAACALNETCMCPHSDAIDSYLRCPLGYSDRKGTFIKYTEYGTCHRYDQSALAIIIRKLFQDQSHHLISNGILQYVIIRRGDNWEKAKGNVELDGNDNDFVGKEPRKLIY